MYPRCVDGSRRKALGSSKTGVSKRNVPLFRFKNDDSNKAKRNVSTEQRVILQENQEQSISIFKYKRRRQIPQSFPITAPGKYPRAQGERRDDPRRQHHPALPRRQVDLQELDVDDLHRISGKLRSLQRAGHRRRL